jgi:predicted ATPase/DNA-binding SARP family transcriptional activator/DNA-binding CsgD family transcriptional regulator
MPETNRPSDLPIHSLQIHLLGGFRVSVDSCLVADDVWRLRKAASLVKLLALSPTHRMHREQILNVLWPDVDSKAATNNLYYALHVARRTLNPGTESPHLRLRSDSVVLAPPDVLWVDVEAFERDAAAARRTGDPATYRSAIALYTGDLLPDDLYEDWVANRREGARLLHLALLLELAMLEEQSEQPGRAIEVLQRALTNDPVCEEAHAGLMRLYARSGQRHQALRQYEQLQHALREELDAEPDETCRQLYEQILTGTLPGPVGRSVGVTSLRRHNLPAALTSFIGREHEIEEVKRLLGTARLLTMTGTGGAGKTRLTLQVAQDLVDRYRDGIWLVELASLADPTQVAQAVAGVLGIAEQAGQSLVTTLVDALQSKHLLLVLDNCEHLVEACAVLTKMLLHSCPELHILATSREALGVDGEVTVVVMPFSVPDFVQAPSIDELLGCEAVRLFVDRAQYRQPTFLLCGQNAAAVTEICRRVDGIPLAIELAAARIGVLSVEELAARLVDALDLLTAGRRTAVAAEGSRHGTVRYRMLEPVRQYAQGLLKESGLDPLVRSRHAQLYLQLAGSAAPHLRGTGQAIWLDRLQMEEDNLREALAWSFSDRGDVEVGVRLAGRIWRFWASRSSLREGQRWLQQAIDQGERADPHDFADVVYASAMLAFGQREYERAGRLSEQAVRLYTDLGDDKGLSEGLSLLGAIRFQRREWVRAIEFHEHALALRRKLGDRNGVATSLGELGLIADETGDLERSQELQEESLAIYREFDNQLLVGILLSNLSILARKRSDFPRARSLLTESLSHVMEVGDKRYVAVDLDLFAVVAYHEGQPGRAARLLGAADTVRESIGAPRQLNFIRALEEVISGLSSTLGERACDALRSAGSAMTLEDAVAYAMSTPEEEPEHAADAFTPPSEEELDSLSRREQEIASLVSEGLTNRRISDQLGISQRTFDTHVGNILSKLGLTSRKQISDFMDVPEKTI